MSSQLLCTYDGESHSVLREESESDSVEEVLQRVFSLVVVVWVTFWSPRRHENRGRGGQGRGHSQADGRSMEEEEGEGASVGRAAAVDAHLGPVSSRARGLFLESVWWLLHRVSGFAFEVPPADWEALMGILDRDIPTQHCPQTMAGAAMLLSVSHARMICEEVEYNQYKESIARAVCSGVPTVFGSDIRSKGEGACVCAGRWLDSRHGSGTCMCALRWAVSRCTNGIVESGALVGLLQWFPVLLASPPRLAPHVSQYSLSHRHQLHEGLQKKNPHMVDKHGHFLYERTIAVDDRAVSDFSLSFLWGAFKHLSCMTPPSTAEDLTQETLDSMTAGLKNLLTAPLIIMASGHSGMGLLGSKHDVLPPSRRDLLARDGADIGDVMGGIDMEDVRAADGFQTNARDVEESGRSRWKLLFSWWLNLDQRLAEQRRLCALMPPPTPIFSPTSDMDMEMEMELERGSDGDGVEIDMHTLAFTQFLSLPAPHPTVGVGVGVGICGEGAQDSPCLVAPVMQYGGVMAHGGQGRAPCHVDDLHASLDYITLASEALQVQPLHVMACLVLSCVVSQCALSSLVLYITSIPCSISFTLSDAPALSLIDARSMFHW